MGSFSIWHWLIVLLVVVLLLGPRLWRIDERSHGAQTHAVYSAVATDGTEVEQIDEVLPKRPKLLWWLLGLVVLAAGTWAAWRVL